MRVVVTGDSGFVGGMVAKLLLQSGHDVVGVSRSVAEFPWRHISADLIWGMPKTDADAVVHAAWHGMGRHSSDVSFAAQNERMIASVCRAVGNSARFIGIGSHVEKFTPSSWYQIDKAVCRRSAFEMFRMASWVRLYPVFGPGDRSTSAIVSVARSLSKRGVAEVGDGLQVRDYISCEYAARAIVRMLESGHDSSPEIARGVGVPMRSIFEMIRRIVGRGGLRFGEVPRRAYDADIDVGDPTLALSLCGPHPDFHECMKEAVLWATRNSR